MEKESELSPLCNALISGMEELKAEEIVCMDLREIPNSITDFFIICNGNSTTQVESIAYSAIEEARKRVNETPFHKEGFQNSTWILLDYMDVIVHVFYKNTREEYDIENLWGDAKIINLKSS